MTVPGVGRVHVTVHLDQSAGCGFVLLGEGRSQFAWLRVGDDDVALLATTVDQLDQLAAAVAGARAGLVVRDLLRCEASA